MLGREIVKHLISKGATVINADIANSNESSSNYRYFNCNIAEESSIQACVNYAIKEFGRLDGLVNNAYPRTKDWAASFENIPFQSWNKNFEMQLASTFVFCREAIANMKKAGQGTIVNIASIYGCVGNDFTVYEGTDIVPAAAYTAIKGGVINFTRYLASLYGKNNIRVNCLSPGGIFDNQPETFVTKYEEKVPMKRMGNPDDIAPGVSFLLSDDAKYITGQNLIIDGGWTCI